MAISDKVKVGMAEYVVPATILVEFAAIAALAWRLGGWVWSVAAMAMVAVLLLVLEKVDASVRLDSIKEVSLALYQNNEVDALLARIERIYQEVDEETQDYLMRLHSEFTKDMETLINNIQKRKRLINQVSQILNQIEESQNVDSLDIFSQEEDEEGEYLA